MRLEWDDSRHALGVAEMDATYREFVAQAAALAACLKRQGEAVVA